MSSSEETRAFKHLLRLVVRAFYPGRCPPASHGEAGEEAQRVRVLAKVDTTGLGQLLIDYLLDREWVDEEQILKDMGQHHKVLRRALKYLEHEHFLMNHSQRETKRSQKRDVVKAAVGAQTQLQRQLQDAAPGGDGTEEDEAPAKQHMYSYWAIDFPRAFDMIQLRLAYMSKAIKVELDAKEAVAKYRCVAAWCAKEYDSYDIMDIIQPDGSMACSMCRGVVEQVLATGQTGDDEQRKARKERLTKLLKDMERQLEPIQKLVNALKHIDPPHHGHITDWARLQQARAAEAAAGGAGGGAGGAARPRANGGVVQLTEAAGAARTALYQETRVQVTIAPAAGAGDGIANSNLPASSVPVVAATGVQPPSSQPPPSLQPFFLQAGGQQRSASPSLPPTAAVAPSQQASDRYAQQLLAAVNVQSQGPQGIGGSAPASKRQKVEGAKVNQDTKAVKAEGLDPIGGAVQAGDDEEWEDI